MELLLMRDTDIFVKTDAGRDEIKSRTVGLPMSVRAILLMVDGQRTVASMRELVAGSKAPSDVLDSLLAQGLIEPIAAPAAAAPPAAAPVPAPAAISAPRVEAGRPAEPMVARSSSVYDGPLDLTLATINGPPSLPASSTPPSPFPAGFATPVPGLNRYEHLYAMMNEIVRDFLSPTRRYFFQLKIERCTSPEELVELLYELQTALAKARGQAFASEVISRLRAAAAN